MIGQVSSEGKRAHSLPFRALKENPTQVANQIKEKIQESRGLIEKIKTENGFINIFITNSGPTKCSCKMTLSVS